MNTVIDRLLQLQAFNEPSYRSFAVRSSESQFEKAMTLFGDALWEDGLFDGAFEEAKLDGKKLDQLLDHYSTYPCDQFKQKLVNLIHGGDDEEIGEKLLTILTKVIYRSQSGTTWEKIMAASAELNRIIPRGPSASAMPSTR